MMAKTTQKTPATTGDKSAAAGVPEPFARLGVGDWFDRWPDMFNRRWAEPFRGMPFLGEGCLMEQFTEEDGTIVLRAELPGMDVEKDVEVTVEDGRMTISGKREEREEHKDKGMYRSEFRYGSFERTVRLPAGARTDDIQAEYGEGILEVRVPVDVAAEGVTNVPIATS